jgi:hypothetical protein
MKKPTLKEIENKMLGELNSFMKDFGIEEINFGKTHKIKKTEGEKAEDVVVKRKKKK